MEPTSRSVCPPRSESMHISGLRSLVAFPCAFAVCATVISAQPPRAADLPGLATGSDESGLPAGWRVRTVRGFQAPTSQILDSAGVRFLRIARTKQAAWFVNELEMPVQASEGRLHWSWRVPLAPEGASAVSPETDDAALRVFVVFERHLRFARTPRALFYTFGEGDAATIFGQRGPMVSINASGAGASGAWVDVKVDPGRDYRRIWREDAQRIIAVGVMQDTDQTMRAAIGDLRHLEWRTSHAPTP